MESIKMLNHMDAEEEEEEEGDKFSSSHSSQASINSLVHTTNIILFSILLLLPHSSQALSPYPPA
jgi:hypothetical protein